MALVKPGETIMGMSLPHGGHLSHGAAVNHSGVVWHAVHYGVDPATGRIDHDLVRDQARRDRAQAHHRGRQRLRAHHRLRGVPVDRRRGRQPIFWWTWPISPGSWPAECIRRRCRTRQVVTSTTHKTLRGPRGGLILCAAEHAKAIDKSVFPGTQGGPLEHVIAAKAVSFGEALTPDFQRYAKQVVANAQALAEELIARGLAIVSGGTDTHLMLVDLRPKNLTGKDAEKILDRAGITVNKNTIPDDPQSPFVTSGIRLRHTGADHAGNGPGEMRKVAELIDKVLTSPDDVTVARVRRAGRRVDRRVPAVQDPAA